MYKKRILAARLKNLVSHFSVVVLSGARQVGKSTLLRHVFPDWDMVVFDPVQDIANARSDPELFLRNHRTPLILDEIQYCPEVLAGIKRIVDENKHPGMYILTGSQQWSVLQTIRESLAGRAVFIDMEGFSLAEIAEVTQSTGESTTAPEDTEDIKRSWLVQYLDDPECFLKSVSSTHKRLPMQRTVYETLWRGSYPEVDALPLELCPDYFSSYLRTYVDRDARMMLEASDWQQFGRFVQLLAALSAQEVNHSKLGREVGISPQTARRWLSVLRATFQWCELPAYHGNTVKKISSKPKGYIADTGLACHLTMISSAKALAGHPLAGSLFETAVIGEIRKLLTATSTSVQLYHWRAHSGSEVDLIIERDGVLHPIEVKLTSQPSRKDTRGITSLRTHYPHMKIAPGLVIAATDACGQISEHDYCIPWDIHI